MSLHLFDSATREITEFVPLKTGEVGIYVCGATVQSSPHIGHLRPAIVFDILRRWLKTSTNCQVTLIRNVTDIDDKVLAKAAEAGEQWWARAARVEREFTAAYDALNVLPPTFEPWATAHITDMVELIGELIEAGHAYVTGPGDVWFDVMSLPSYGELTGQKVSDLAPDESSEQLAATVKRSPYDFALWKAPKPTEPTTAAWDTPWGRGRPGWHLECSAMAGRYLGPEFDIHGGGLDLRFPHHENEQAQSRAAGRPFARRWMHSAWITQSGAKMSKSLGNGLLAAQLLREAEPAVIRYAIASAHYASMLEWTDDTLTEAGAAWERITGFVQRASEFGSERSGGESAQSGVDETAALVATTELPPAFVAAMDDDLNVPAALAVVHEHVRLGNVALSNNDADAATLRSVQVRAMLDVLGLDPQDPHWSKTDSGDAVKLKAALETLVAAQLGARADARAEKDWAKADQVRDLLKEAGISIEDSKTGPRWELT